MRSQRAWRDSNPQPADPKFRLVSELQRSLRGGTGPFKFKTRQMEPEKV